MSVQAAPRTTPDTNPTTNRREPVAPALAVTAVRRPYTNANRQAMPIIASVADQFRQGFGVHQVRVAYAEEAGRKLGAPPPPGVKPAITDAGAPKRATRKKPRS